LAALEAIGSHVSTFAAGCLFKNAHASVFWRVRCFLSESTLQEP